MAALKTGPGGVAQEPQADGFILTGGTTDQRALTVDTANCTIDQDLQISASPTWAGVTIDAVAITSIDNVAGVMTDDDAALATCAAIIDYIDGLTAAGIDWEVVTVDDSPAVGVGLFCNDADGTTTVTLPGTFAVGDTIRVSVVHATNTATITPPAGDNIIVNELVGANAGTLVSITSGACVTLVGYIADTTWVAVDMMGAWTINTQGDEWQLLE